MEFARITQTEHLLMLRDELNESLKRVGVKKEKVKAAIRIALTLVCVGGGVATAILVPGPLTITILGGLGFLFTRNGKFLDRVGKKNLERKMLKKKLEEVNNQIG